MEDNKKMSWYGLIVCLTFLLSILTNACTSTAAAPSSVDETESMPITSTETEQTLPIATETKQPIPTATMTEPAPEPTDPTPASTMLTDGTQRSRKYIVQLSAESIVAPEVIRPGLAEITIENTDSTWHAAIFRRLNDDVSLEDFDAAFLENPFTTLPLTYAIGGPDVPAGERIEGMFFLNEGTYVVVDNWSEPARYTVVNIEGQMVDAAAPDHNVMVRLEEYSITMPESIASGPQLWKFVNKGTQYHNLGIVQLDEGKTVDDIIAWMDEMQSPMPMQEIVLWNVLDPTGNSWGTIDLPPGEYLALDFLPDFANGGGWNMEQGMYKAFTVSPWQILEDKQVNSHVF